MRIQHNIMAMNSYRNYNNNTSALSSNLEKLSSGYKINRAGDDAAGLAISEKMRAQISGLEQASSNVKDGISLVKTGEGAMQEIQDMLNRMTTLATQSANGTYDNDTDRAQLQKEVENLKSEINRIADSSNFNGISLLDGSLSGKSQVSNLTITNTTAQVGKYSIGTAFGDVTFGANSLNKQDIDSTIDYTVTWKDASGTEKTTTVSLTFKGQGDGTVADLGNTSTANKNYFVDDQGTRYTLGTDGKLAASSISAAVKAGLEADSAFNEVFKVDMTGDKLSVEARQTGSNGATLLSTGDYTSIKTAAGAKAVLDDMDGAGNASMTQQPLDSLQKFDVTKLKVVGKGADAATIASAAFEVDGHKFLLVSSDYSDAEFKALDSDITAIKSATAATAGGTSAAAAGDLNTVSNYITQVTGLTTRKGDTANANGETTNDIVFSEDNLKLGGTELQLQIGDTSDDYNQMGVKIDDMHTDALGISNLDISTQDGAAKAIDIIKNAINQVSSTRGTLGATQNRLEHTQNNLSVMTENIQDAESTIRDTDIAEEMMSYTKNNILVQSAQAMLAQANSVPQGVLQLLQ